MKVEIKTGEGCLRQMEMVIPPEITKEKLKQTLLKFRKESDIPGFRRGRAPLGYIKSKFKKEVEADLKEELIKEYLEKAFKEKEVSPVGLPEISSMEILKDGSFQLNCSFEVMPEFDPKDYKGIKIEKKPVQIKQEDIDQYLQSLKEQYSEKQVVVGRPVQENDYVVIEIWDKNEDQNILGMEKLSMDTVIGSNLLFPGTEFEKSLIGLNIDQPAEILINFPENYPRTDLGGKKAEFMVTIKEIKISVLPEINDEFVKKHTEAQSLEELIARFKEKRKIELLEKQRGLLKQLIVEKALINNPFPLPKTLVNEQIERVKKSFPNATAEQATAIAENAVREAIFLKRIAIEEKITVDEQEMIKRLENLVKEKNVDPQKVIADMKANGTYDDFEFSILQEKVKDFLFENAEIIEIAEEK